MMFQKAMMAPPTEEKPSALDRIGYLCPSRYFRFYMLHDRASYSTCWLPEGYNS